MLANASEAMLLPGDEVPSSLYPTQTAKSGILKLGPGLAHEPPSIIRATVAGPVCTEMKKNTMWIDNHSGRYIAQTNDTVIATVHHSSTDVFHVALTPHTAFALLPQLAFENATKKTRPQLQAGALVYARVVSSPAHNRFQEPELACFNPSTGKAEGLGELKGGTVFPISMEMAARLLVRKQIEDGGVSVLEALAKKWPFEVAVGRNGYVWVDAQTVKRTIIVGRALTETDKFGLMITEQEKLVKRLCRELEVD